MSAEDHFPVILDLFVEQVQRSGTRSILNMEIPAMMDAPQHVLCAYVHTSNNPTVQGAQDAWKDFASFCRQSHHSRRLLGLAPRQFLHYMNLTWDVFSSDLIVSSFQTIVDRHLAKENGVFDARALRRDWDQLTLLE